MVLDNLRYFATLARHVPGLPAGQYVRGFDSVMRREPVGVCGCVAPWNYPLAMAVWKLGPALAAGNCLVLKPADTTPVTTSRLAEIIGEHRPVGVFNVVIGDRDTGRALLRNALVDLVSVTGSVAAGRRSPQAPRRASSVFNSISGQGTGSGVPDADLDVAAEGIAAAAFMNAGQDRAAATRVLASSVDCRRAHQCACGAGRQH